MSDHNWAEALFLEHLGWIERVAAIACAKHNIRGAEAEDFASWVKVRLMEDDYAVLRRFRGESNVKTYLAVVVSRNFFEYARERRGEWRSSAAAERIGPLATELERLVFRDGYSLRAAGERLRTAGRTTQSDAELARLFAHLPIRGPLRPVELPLDQVLNATPGTSSADERVVSEESQARRDRVIAALNRVLMELEPEELLIVRMHYGEGRTVADVARILHLEQKPLYRRVERLRTRLRTSLESAGLREDGVREILPEPEST